MSRYAPHITIAGSCGGTSPCGFPEQDAARTKVVTLNFLRSELLYDAQNYAFVLGDVMKVNDEHQRHQLQDIVEDGNRDRVTRVLNLWMAIIREALYPYTKNEVEDGESRTDTLTEVEEYSISMLVPDDYSKTTITLLEQLIHEILICRVLEDWVSITDPGHEDIWKQKAEDAMQELNRVKNGRAKKVRRKQHPVP